MARAAGTESDPIFFRNPAEYRKWLEKNHSTAKELWIGYYKKATGKPSLTWEQTVDESLCFGWIDGIRKSIDEESFKQRVTPRRPTSVWSQINIRKIGELSKAGLMQPAGLAAFEKRDSKRTYSYESFAAPLGRDQEKIFRANKKAWEFWLAQPAGYKRLASWYVMSAKQEATRQRRLERLIVDSAAGRRIGMLETKKKAKA
jgi:uncharacterized protein YdeI (YjbR/CyaY-like superfamily)